MFNQAQTTLIAYPVGLAGGYTISNNVTSIGVNAFESAESLTSVAIPNSVTSIGNGAFFACDSLTSVTIPSSVTSIGYGAFLACTNLTSAYFLGNAASDNGTAFIDDPATVYYLAGTMGWSATFGGVPAVSLTSQALFIFTTNNGAITITGYTGSGGAVFIPVTINSYPVTSIGEGAFVDGVSLTSVIIPNSVINIGVATFNDCTSLTNVIIPNSVLSIGNGAFDGCANLPSVTIPNSVTNIGEQAFTACFSLTNITVAANNPDFSSVNGVLFDQTQATLIAYPGGLGGGYTIPDSVTAIGEVAFFDCTNLTSVTIPNNVTTIEYAAFRSCFSLTNITVVAGNPDFSSVNGVLFDQTQTTLIEFPGGLEGGYTIPNSVSTIGEPGFADCFHLTSVTIPNRVTGIGQNVFADCPSLTNITVVAGDLHFSSVNGVLFDQTQTTLITYPGGLDGDYTIPNGVTKIGETAFLDCTNLTSITIPNSITSIGVAAFSDCPRLTSAYFPGTLRLIMELLSAVIRPRFIIWPEPPAGVLPSKVCRRYYGIRRRRFRA